MFVGIRNFTGPCLVLDILNNFEHQPRLEWQLVSIFVFLQTVMVKSNTAKNSHAAFLNKMI